MNILFVTPAVWSPNKAPSGGFMTYLYRISQSLHSLGHRPIILAVGNRNRRWVENGIEIIQVYDGHISVSNNKCINWIYDSFKKSYKLNHEIKQLESKMKIDIIQFASTTGTALLYYGKTPAVMRLSMYSKNYFSEDEISAGNCPKTMAWIERCASRHCNAVFAPSKAIADAFCQDVRRKVYVIETPYVEGVDVYDDYYVKTYLKGKKYALFFGLLAARKGIDVIGECLERFLRENKDYYFVFVGKDISSDGEKVKMLRKCAGVYADRVVIFPVLPHAQLYPIIQSADFVVLPSIADNFPNACIEAMSLGKVVIGTYGASFDQMIRHGISGLLCQIGNSDDLLEKMKMAVLFDDRQKECIGHNAKKRVERLKPEIVGEKLLSFYQYNIENLKKDT